MADWSEFRPRQAQFAADFAHSNETLLHINREAQQVGADMRDAYESGLVETRMTLAWGRGTSLQEEVQQQLRPRPWWRVW